jgi:hypothetical protein
LGFGPCGVRLYREALAMAKGFVFSRMLENGDILSR